MEIPVQGAPQRQKHDAAARIAAGAWGSFFLWVGIAIMADVGTGWGLLGIGVITLSAQLARRLAGLSLEGFWVIIGGLFAIGGIWELIGATVALTPLLLIAVGLTLLVTALTGRGPSHSRPH